jgi:hypothetical protein
MQTKTHFQRYEEAPWEATDLFLIGGPDIAPICIRFQDSDPDCQCRDKTPAIVPVLPIRAAVSLGGDAVGTLQ